MSMNFAKIAKATIATLIIVMMFGSTMGCAIAKSTAPEPTSTMASTLTSTPTLTPERTASPTPTIEVTPAPTHAPELSLEEERELLGVRDVNEVIDFNCYSIMLFALKDENGIEVKRLVWFAVGIDMQDNVGLYNIWDEKKLYSLSKETNDIRELLKTAMPTNKRLEDAVIIDLVGMPGIEDFYMEHGIDYQIPKECRYYFSSYHHTHERNYFLPMTEVMNLYISCTPKEYRTTWMDFDESLIYSNPTPQP